MSIRARIMEVYNNRLPDQIPTGIYKRYLRTGEIERSARNAGLGILDFVPVVSLMSPPWHLHQGYVSEVRNVSFDVKFEGKGVARAFDLMLHNDKNTPPFPLLQGPIIPIPSDEKPICLMCGKPIS